MDQLVLEAVRGDDNFWNFDVTGDIDIQDTITFRAARKMADLTDANALIKKGRGTGIVDISAAAGTFQVQLEPSDTASLAADEALVFHVVIHKDDVLMETTVAKGLVRLL